MRELTLYKDLKKFVGSYLDAVGFGLLWECLPLILASWFFFTCLSGASRYLGPSFFPQVFSKLTPAEKRKMRLTWPHHTVSLVHALIVSILAFRAIILKELPSDPVWGYSESVMRMVAFSAGYFLWDLKVSIHYWKFYGSAFLMHALMASSSMVVSFRPYMHYYAPFYLLYEVSTIFVNGHWFLGKMGLEGSRLQLVNDVLLILAYLVIRIVLGWWISVHALSVIYQNRAETSPVMMIIYGGSILLSNCLNAHWFRKLLLQAINK